MHEGAPKSGPAIMPASTSNARWCGSLGLQQLRSRRPGQTGDIHFKSLAHKTLGGKKCIEDHFGSFREEERCMHFIGSSRNTFYGRKYSGLTFFFRDLSPVEGTPLTIATCTRGPPAPRSLEDSAG